MLNQKLSRLSAFLWRQTELYGQVDDEGHDVRPFVPVGARIWLYYGLGRLVDA
jgi:hypothetical protein